MATTSAAVRELSDYNSQGTRLGRSSSDLISFYGATPGTRGTTATTAATLGDIGTQTASSGGFGASTAAIMTSTFALVDALQTDVANIYASLKTLGLIDGA